VNDPLGAMRRNMSVTFNQRTARGGSPRSIRGNTARPSPNDSHNPPGPRGCVAAGRQPGATEFHPPWHLQQPPCRGPVRHAGSWPRTRGSQSESDAQGGPHPPANRVQRQQELVTRSRLGHDVELVSDSSLGEDVNAHGQPQSLTHRAAHGAGSRGDLQFLEDVFHVRSSRTCGDP
jgi:hypothetical protein